MAEAAFENLVDIFNRRHLFLDQEDGFVDHEHEHENTVRTKPGESLTIMNCLLIALRNALVFSTVLSEV